MALTVAGVPRYLMSLITLRKARVISISFFFVAHCLYNHVLHYTTTNQIIIGDNDIIDPNNGTPEASLPEHHAPLPWDPPDSILSAYYTESNVTNSTPSSVWFDAVDTNGNRGYVADPTLFRRSVLQWHSQHTNATYWDRLQRYQSHLQLDINSSDSLTMDEICSLTERKGGRELNDGGMKMVMEFVKVDTTPIVRKGCTENPPLQHDRPKLFCGIYTHNPARDFTRLAALSYGWKCDGFLAFSTVTIPSLGMVGLLHRGEEAYGNMVQKTRSIWSYIATHYLDQFDYFHIGGDDMHVIVENMRSLLLEHETKIYDAGKQGRIFGQLTPTGNHHFFRGGAGYTIDRVGLKRLHDYMPKCATKTYGPWEDNIISKCAWDLRLTFSDNRDSCSGQQRSHTENPGVLFNAQGLSQSEIDKRLRIWASLPHPIIPTREVGLKVGLDAASNHSVTFHRLHYPPWMVRHHALLYHACPSNTPLGNFANEKGDSITAGGA